ncbi:MAG: hypothetical protein D6717_02370 [Gammaproteobacteria bacterium]|nr:MAG: hypothetical protein D6717_02370 [Gammaproteobacteria bacterium]
MPHYEIKRPFKLGGDIHKPGDDLIELDADAAAPLVESGALAESPVPAKGDDAGETAEAPDAAGDGGKTAAAAKGGARRGGKGAK